jgi:RimJ/RimL family protein N-acetyltransferase
VEVNFIHFDKNFLEASHIWLQDEELCKLIDVSPVTKLEQETWYKGLSYKNDYFIWGVMADGLPIGVCGLKHVKYGQGEYWGYIGAKSYWGKGIGSKMIHFIEEFAYSINLEIVHLRVLRYNSRAYELYLRKGYIIYDESEDVLFMKKNLMHD